jgi:hypothetical protein
MLAMSRPAGHDERVRHAMNTVALVTAFLSVVTLGAGCSSHTTGAVSGTLSLGGSLQAGSCVRATNDKGKVVSTVQTDRDGSFVMHLAPGTYSLQGKPSGSFGWMCSSNPVDVAAHATVRNVQLGCSTPFQG